INRLCCGLLGEGCACLPAAPIISKERLVVSIALARGDARRRPTRAKRPRLKQRPLVLFAYARGSGTGWATIAVTANSALAAICRTFRTRCAGLLGIQWGGGLLGGDGVLTTL